MKLYSLLFFILNFVFFSGSVKAQEPNDCVNAIVACGNSNLNSNVNGFGVQELNGTNVCGGNGSSLGEIQSVWIQVTLETGGTFGFTLRPSNTSIDEDYDFFVFGPNVSCNNIGQAIRCSSTNPRNANQGNNLTGMNGTSTETNEGPGSDGDSFVRWLDVQAGETYFIVINRFSGLSEFSLEWTGSARFSDPPRNEAISSGTPLNIENCDITLPFDDGFTEFDLESNTNAISGTQTDVTVTYYETESDAIIANDAITSPYTNSENPKTIFARITNNRTRCFDITQFNLNVNLGPNFRPPSDYEICDNLNDGDDANGRAEFILSNKNSEILDGQDPIDINITYHSSLTGAEQGTTSTLLPDNYYNNTAFTEEIYIRIEEANNVNCVSTTPLILRVNSLPTRIDHTILQCDEDGVTDNLTIFNLNEANSVLTNGMDNLSTKFFLDSAKTNEIINTNNFTNTLNPQTIYVEVLNNNTSCTKDAELILEVSTTDSFDTDLITCDDDGIEDGFYTFNLNDANMDIVSSLPTGLDISYFENYDDALREQNNLSNIYTNTIPNSQIIYARVENNNNCYGISEVELIVNELPDIETEVLTNYCLNFFPRPITINAGLNSGSITDYLYDWSTGENNYSIQINEVGNFVVNVTHRTTNCTKQSIVIVEPSNIATIESIDITDATLNNIVIINTTGEGIYEYSLINNEGNTHEFQESNIFENIKPGIYTVLVKDIENACGTIQQNISVIGFPKFFTPNNDGENDTWQVYGISRAFQSETKILIYSRYGKLLKELSPLEKGWDGVFNGQILPTDDYWFSVILEDGRVFKNHFTLKR